MLKDMEMVYAIYKAGSFSKAADELYINQSSLSMAIQRIENEMGASLFERHRRPVKLTQVGEQYLLYYQKIKILEKDMRASIDGLSNLEKGDLSLGGTHYLISYVLQDAICQFQQRYPHMNLKIRESQASQFNEMLLDCEIDLCLKCELDGTGLQSFSHAFFDNLVLAVPKSMIAQYSMPNHYLTREQILDGNFKIFEHYITPQEFCHAPFLQLTPGNNLYCRCENIFEQFGVVPDNRIYLQQFVTAYNLAQNGLGSTLTSLRLIKNTNQTNLVYYGIASPLMVRDFHFIIRKAQYVPNNIRAFCSLFQKMNADETVF